MDIPLEDAIEAIEVACALGMKIPAPKGTTVWIAVGLRDGADPSYGVYASYEGAETYVEELEIEAFYLEAEIEELTVW
jgi:hypothetical protein